MNDMEPECPSACGVAAEGQSCIASNQGHAQISRRWFLFGVLCIGNLQLINLLIFLSPSPINFMGFK